MVIFDLLDRFSSKRSTISSAKIIRLKDHTESYGYMLCDLGLLCCWSGPRQGRSPALSPTARSPSGVQDFMQFARRIGFDPKQAIEPFAPSPGEMVSVSCSFITSGKGVPAPRSCGIPFQDLTEVDQ